MTIVVLKLFAGQGTGWTDRWTEQRLYASSFGEHNKTLHFPCFLGWQYATLMLVLKKKSVTNIFVNLF